MSRDTIDEAGWDNKEVIVIGYKEAKKLQQEHLNVARHRSWERSTTITHTITVPIALKL